MESAIGILGCIAVVLIPIVVIMAITHSRTMRHDRVVALLRNNPGEKFGAADVAAAFNVSIAEGSRYINSLRGDQSHGWAIDGHDANGYRVTYVDPTSLR